MSSSGCVHWFYTHPTLPTPISETHEFLKLGNQNSIIGRAMSKKLVDFISSNTKNGGSDVRFEKFQREKETKIYKTSSYRRDYSMPYPPKCPPKKALDHNLDFVFNRRPVNDFYMLPSAPGKFMDDHFVKPSEAKQRINFFRQIRNLSYLEKSSRNDAQETKNSQ